MVYSHKLPESSIWSPVLRWIVSLDLTCIRRATEKTAIRPGAARMMTAWLRLLIQKRLLKRQVMGLSPNWYSLVTG